MPQPCCDMVHQCLQSYMYFGKYFFIKLDTKGSNILTMFPTTALENAKLSFFNLQLHLAALTPCLSDQFH